MNYSRRKFMVDSSTLVAGASVGFQMMTKKRSKSDTINLGIIGTGDRGGGLMKNLLSFPGFRVIACCDLIPFRLEAAAAIHENCVKYVDYHNLLENKDIDAVIIATPLSEHHQMAIDALDAGKHVYCEKTMVFHTQEVFDLIKKVENSDKVFQVGHQYRSTPLYNRVTEMIRAGYLGEVSNVYIQWNRNGNWRRPVPEPQYEKLINWRMYREFSGGLTAELLSHQLDFVNHIFSTHPNKVMGMGGIDYWKDGRETFDNVNLMYHYPGGMTVNAVSLTSNAYEGYKMIFKGSKASLELDMYNAWIYAEDAYIKELGEVDGVSGATVNYDQEGKGIPVKAYSTHPEWSNSDFAIQSFYESLQDNKQPYSNVYNGGKTALCVRMALDAMINNKIVEWNNDYKAVLRV